MCESPREAFVGTGLALSHMHQVKEKGVSLLLLRTNKKAPFPMTTITELSDVLQTLLTTTANTVAKKQVLSSGSEK